MAYGALTFWMLVAVSTAWGVHRLVGGVVKPKVLNAILLPGTLVAQLGRVLGLLVTGATVRNTTLYKDDESGDPETDKDPEPRIPVLGPIVISLLPILTCGLLIYVVARFLGGPFLNGLPEDAVAPSVPRSLGGFWELLRDLVTLAEAWVEKLLRADYARWQTWAFLYLVVCLAVRMAPFPGSARGAIGAIVVLGIAGAAITSLFQVGDARVQWCWAVLRLTVATLLVLLLASLIVRGVAALIQVLRGVE